VGVCEEVEKAPLRCGGGIYRVVNVACDAEHVGFCAADMLNKPIEKRRVFVVALEAVEGLAEMPVSCVEKF